MLISTHIFQPYEYENMYSYDYVLLSQQFIDPSAWKWGIKKKKERSLIKVCHNLKIIFLPNIILRNC